MIHKLNRTKISIKSFELWKGNLWAMQLSSGIVKTLRWLLHYWILIWKRHCLAKPDLQASKKD